MGAVLRRPTNAEQAAAQIETSDYQISGLTICSSILTTLGLCPRVYRTKRMAVKFSNVVRMKRCKGLFSRMFASLPGEGTVADLREALTCGGAALAERLGFDVVKLLSRFETWQDALAADPGTELAAMATASKPSGLSNSDLERIEVQSGLLAEWLAGAAASGTTLKRFLVRAAVVDAFKSTLEGNDDFAGFDIDAHPDGEPLEKFKADLLAYADSATHTTERVYTWRLLNSEAHARQEAIKAKLGVTGKLTLADAVRYWEEREPFVLSDCKELYGIDLHGVEDWEHLARLLYEPARMRAIRESLHVKVKPRSPKGEEQDGTGEGEPPSAPPVPDPSAYSGAARAAAERVVHWTGVLLRTRSARDAARAEYDAAAARGVEPREAELMFTRWEELGDAATQAAKNLHHAERDFGRLKLSCPAPDDNSIPYYTWTFRVRNGERVADFLVGELKRGFGQVDYVNVSRYPSRDASGAPAHAVSVDYPESSKLHGLLSKRPDFTKDVIAALSREVSGRFGSKLDVDDEMLVDEVFEDSLARA